MYETTVCFSTKDTHDRASIDEVVHYLCTNKGNQKEVNLPVKLETGPYDSIVETKIPGIYFGSGYDVGYVGIIAEKGLEKEADHLAQKLRPSKRMKDVKRLEEEVKRKIPSGKWFIWDNLEKKLQNEK